MEILSLEVKKIIKDIRNLFRLKKQLSYILIKDIKNLFSQEKETKAIKNRSLNILRIFLSMKKKKIIVIQ